MCFQREKERLRKVNEVKGNQENEGDEKRQEGVKRGGLKRERERRHQETAGWEREILGGERQCAEGKEIERESCSCQIDDITC